MKLANLLSRLVDCKIFGPVNLNISAISDDSRTVKPGSFFIAVQGFTLDGHKFIPQAIKNGASAVLGEQAPNKRETDKVTYIQVKNSRKALGVLASSWFDNPSKKLKVIGVTGTDGKTTTATLIHKILQVNGEKSALITTLGAEIGEKKYDTGFHVTTPDTLPLQKFLAKIVKTGCKYAILETTSHGLGQDRVAGIDFYAGVLTNITHEHLDYHKTYDSYRNAKAKLFKETKLAVLNSDDDSFNFIKKQVPHGSKTISYALKTPADIRGDNIKIESSRMKFTIEHSGKEVPIQTKLFGEYNVYNILAAAGLTQSLSVSWPKIQKAVASFKPLVGRLEKIESNRPFDIYVDFAHTPNSLEKVLTLLVDTKQKTGRLIAVFGCAGERDTQKRPLMGKISGSLADISIFTAEDPRSEDVNKIIDQMADGAKQGGATEGSKNGKGNQKHVYFRKPERGEAIKFAASFAKKGDIVVICGKGHERSMAYNGVEYPWSDQEAAQSALRGETKVIKRGK
ncbi:UDP-N-acetylmuramoyl-L-alanyl-D-glutamate--2,6-diaminopimelate ligase [Candidatus Woesebacteria bacterium]|nr:UDP-N-acetylmuramoyl-L-alanyl-D-glutamate--2,6-diaminopimelate ligase [Candidatus Woesebacteria bacterium]|tara:strand:- start:342 stop:1874 length:1533 start_codon:yes stop_codon:yes gene_type:complete